MMRFAAQVEQLTDISGLLADNIASFGKPDPLALFRDNSKDIGPRTEDEIQRDMDPFSTSAGLVAGGHIHRDTTFMNVLTKMAHKDTETREKRREEEERQSRYARSAVASVTAEPVSYTHPKPPCHPHVDHSTSARASFTANATSPAHPHPKTPEYAAKLSRSVATTMDHITSGTVTLNDARSIRDNAVGTVKDAYHDTRHAVGDTLRATVGKDATDAIRTGVDTTIGVVKKSAPVVVATTAFNAVTHPFKTYDDTKKVAGELVQAGAEKAQAAGAAISDAVRDPGKAASNIADSAGKAWNSFTSSLPSLGK